MEQINESLVTDYFVKFGKFVIKWVHHPCYSFWGVGGKTYLWANPEKGWVEKKVNLDHDDVEHITEKQALKIARVSHW